MKRFVGLLVTAFLGLSLFVVTSGLALADDNRCPLTGNTYVFSMEGTDFELSGFECTFGPGCEAICDLWFGNFDTGPLYHERLPFVCTPEGNVAITVNKTKIPCALNAKGNLECLINDVSGFYCVRLGERVWCLPELPYEFQFDLVK